MICNELNFDCINWIDKEFFIVNIFFNYQVAEAEVNNLCLEAQECIVLGRWLDLASLMLTTADLIFTKLSEPGNVCNRKYSLRSLGQFGGYGDPYLVCRTRCLGYSLHGCSK